MDLGLATSNIARFFAPQLEAPFQLRLPAATATATSTANSVVPCLGRDGLVWPDPQPASNNAWITTDLQQLLQSEVGLSYTTRRRYWPFLHVQLQGRGSELADQVAALEAANWYCQANGTGCDVWLFFHQPFCCDELSELFPATTPYLKDTIVNSNVPWRRDDGIVRTVPDHLPMPARHSPSGRPTGFDQFFSRPLQELVRPAGVAATALVGRGWPDDPQSVHRGPFAYLSSSRYPNYWSNHWMSDELVDELYPLVYGLQERAVSADAAEPEVRNASHYAALAVAMHVRNKTRQLSPGNVLHHLGLSRSGLISEQEALELWCMYLRGALARLCPRSNVFGPSNQDEQYDYYLDPMLTQYLDQLGFWLRYDEM